MGCCQRTSASTPTTRPVRKLDLRLVVQDELVRGDRPPELADERKASGAEVPELLAVLDDTGAGLLGGVHREVRALQELVHRRRRASGYTANPMLASALTGMPPSSISDGERRLHPIQHLAGRPGVAFEHETELVAAEPGDGVARSNRLLQGVGDVAEERITVVMTERVVDLLEAVEVEHGDRDTESDSLGCGERLIARGRRRASGSEAASTGRAAPGTGWLPPCAGAGGSPTN